MPVNVLLVDDTPAKLLTYEVILGELGENLLKAVFAHDALQTLLNAGSDDCGQSNPTEGGQCSDRCRTAFR